MAQISETSNPTMLKSALRDGLEQVDLKQVVTFTQYTRAVLPLDKWVYWVKAHTIDVKGSLHYGQVIQQNEDETQGLATVQFTAEEQVPDFVSAPINTLFVAEADGFQFAFSQQQGFYTQAGLWHYFGHSVQPALSTQLISSADQIDVNQAVVCNSLPLWMALNDYKSPFYDGFSNTGVPFRVKPPVLYPSFIVDENEIPPYGSVHIGDNDTTSQQAAPYLDRNRSHWQLCQDHVRITLYGLQNNVALDFMDTINQYSLMSSNFGIVNMTPPRDAVRTQSELRARAMKKVIEVDVSYNQARVNEIARQLITSAMQTFIFQG